MSLMRLTRLERAGRSARLCATVGALRANSLRAISVTLGCLAVLSACGRADIASPLVLEAPVRTKGQSTSSGSQTIRASCTIASQQSVKLKPQVSGEIGEVLVQLGDRVRAGQVLARMKREELELERERLQVLLAQSKGREALLVLQLERATRDLDAAGPLYKPSVVEMSREALAVRERQAELAHTELARRAQLIEIQAVERRLAHTEIRSPMTGVVIARQAEVGMVTGSGLASIGGTDVLFEIGDLERLRAECAARQSDAARLRVGMTMALSVDGREANTPISLHVSRIAPSLTNQGGAIYLSFWGDFNRPEYISVLPGMQASTEVQIVSPGRNGKE